MVTGALIRLNRYRPATKNDTIPTPAATALSVSECSSRHKLKKKITFSSRVFCDKTFSSCQDHLPKIIKTIIASFGCCQPHIYMLSAYYAGCMISNMTRAICAFETEVLKKNVIPVSVSVLSLKLCFLIWYYRPIDEILKSVFKIKYYNLLFYNMIKCLVRNQTSVILQQAYPVVRQYFYWLGNRVKALTDWMKTVIVVTTTRYRINLKYTKWWWCGGVKFTFRCYAIDKFT